MITKEINNVCDIIELEYLQKIQDSFGKICKVTTVVLDAEGVTITQPTNLNAFCALMQTSPNGSTLCMKTNKRLTEINRQTKAAAAMRCPHSGLKTAAVPIFVGEKYLGSWLVGQIRVDQIDPELVTKTATVAGVDPEEALAGITSLPQISEQEFDDMLGFLEIFTKEITELAQVNDTLNTKNSELTELSSKLNISSQTFRDFIDLSDVGAYVLDYHTGELLMYNNRFAAFVERQYESLIGRKCYEVLGQQDWCPDCPRRSLLDEDGEPGGAVIWENHLAAFHSWLRITSRAIRWTDGRLAQMVTFLDITEQKEQEERISYIAYYDQRLKISNGMRLFLDINERVLNNPYIICFDIRGLRKINDAYGRESGDHLMSEIKDWILSLGLEYTQLYRVAGDEFAMLITDHSEEEVMQIAKRLWNRFEEPWTIRLGEEVQQRIYAGISLGVIPCEEMYNTYADLLNTIERILSTARDQNAPLLYDAEINKRFREHLQLEMSLKACVLNKMKGFSLHYQPIVDPITGQWLGLEALCRWESPELGPVSPGVFIPEAEQLGLIELIGQWVLQEALRQVKEWQLDQLEHFKLHVNLSPLQLSDRSLSAHVTQVLRQTQYPADKLSLEITESAEIHFDGHIMESLEQLRNLGISLSLDDFGTGYASFSSLNYLPVSILKTDRSFVNNIEVDGYLQHTIRIMVEFAHAANMEVVAEGVETEGQMRILLRNGVDYFQGFLFARPLPVAEIAKNLHKFQKHSF